jgi:putative IMPACT (imprinted ancient) family translation regulator
MLYNDLSTSVCTTAKIPHTTASTTKQTIEMVPEEHHDARHQMVAFCMLSKTGCQPQIQVTSIY